MITNYDLIRYAFLNHEFKESYVELNGLTTRQIANHLGLPYGSVSKAISKLHKEQFLVSVSFNQYIYYFYARMPTYEYQEKISQIRKAFEDIGALECPSAQNQKEDE